MVELKNHYVSLTAVNARMDSEVPHYPILVDLKIFLLPELSLWVLSLLGCLVRSGVRFLPAWCALRLQTILLRTIGSELRDRLIRLTRIAVFHDSYSNIFRVTVGPPGIEPETAH